jgi:uncharacterized repeat protein (TIGR03943 family)
VNRDTQSVLLLLVGGAVVRISVDDTFLRYVKDWMRPGLLAAGGVLVLLGLVSLWREHLAGRAAPPTDPEPVLDEHGHDDDHGPRIAWLLLLPVLAIFLVAPPALGSYTASRSSAAAAPAEPDSEFAPLPAGDPVTTTLTDYATRAIWDRGRSLAGRRIRLVGFVTPRPAGGFYLTRITITCCAADARPVRIAVRGGERTFPADTWVAVTGTYGGRDEAAKAADRVPVVRAESVDVVKAPAEPYES